ncbi:MAG: SAM-dependent methyltransferase [Desulfobacteraceae bacterium]|nr:MAG: SAM-dependent methyltransferase [Desulfobacteraceae bacterium]
MEAGTGIYNPASAPFLLSGVKKLILLEPFHEKKIDYEKFSSRFLKLLDIADKESNYPLPKNGTVLQHSRDHIHTAHFPPDVELLDNLWENTGLPDGSVDLIFSASVLEHIRHPEAVLSESARILRPDGYMINYVDLRDHFSNYPFEMFKYSERMWNLLTKQSGGAGYQNRWRISHWKRALENAGFSSQTIPLKKKNELALHEKQYFTPEFKKMPIEDFGISVLLISQKKHNKIK